MEMFRPRCRQVIESESEEEENVDTILVSGQLHTELSQDTIEEEEEETLSPDNQSEPEQTEPQPAGTILFSTFHIPQEKEKTSNGVVSLGNDYESESQTKEPSTDDVTLINDDESSRMPGATEEGNDAIIVEEDIEDSPTNQVSLLDNIVIAETEDLSSFFQ